MRVVDWLIGRRVDPDRQVVVKLFPRLIPRRGENVLVDGERCRVTRIRVGDFQPAGPGLVSYRIIELRVKGHPR